MYLSCMKPKLRIDNMITAKQNLEYKKHIDALQGKRVCVIFTDRNRKFNVSLTGDLVTGHDVYSVPGIAFISTAVKYIDLNCQVPIISLSI